MATSIQPISLAVAKTDPAATTRATASTATTNAKNTVPAAVPQDTVTISAQATALASGAVAQTANANAALAAVTPANANSAPVAATPANAAPAPEAATPASATAAQTAAAVTSTTSSALALQQEVQQLSFQGLSASEIATNLNIPLSEVQLYLPGAQAAPTTQTAPPPPTAGTNNAASTANTPATPKIQPY
jgi:hypothetical protein